MKNIGEETEIRGVLPVAEVKNATTNKVYTNLVGFKYPIVKDGSRGYFSKCTNIEATKSCLNQLLRTERGERLMTPDYGASLKSLLFEPSDADLKEQIRERVIGSLSKYLPNVKVIKIKITTFAESGSLNFPGFKVSLWCQLRGDLQSTFEVSVNL
jgi:phage baseplate assembly protein W